MMMQEYEKIRQKSPLIASKLYELSDACKKLGYNLQINEINSNNDWLAFKLIISNPKNGGEATMSYVISLRSYTEELQLIETVNAIIRKLSEKELDWNNDVVKRVAEKVLLGSIDGRGFIPPYNQKEKIYVTKMALETGFRVKFTEFTSLKCLRETFKNFLGKYLETYGKLPISEIDEWINNEEPYEEPCIYYPELSEHLPRDLAILYLIRSLENLTEEDIDRVRKILFEGNPSSRRKAATAIVFHLRFQENGRLDELLAEYMREKADRKHALELLDLIFTWDLSVSLDPTVLRENFVKSLETIVRKALNIEDAEIMKIDDVSERPSTVKVILRARRNNACISLTQEFGRLTIEVGGFDSFFEDCKTKLILESYTPEDMNDDACMLVDGYISRSIEYVKNVKKIGTKMLSKIPPEIVKLAYIGRKPIKVVSYTHEGKMPLIKLSSYTLRREGKSIVESFLGDFEAQTQEALNNLGVKFGDEFIPKERLDEWLRRQAKHKRTQYTLLS